MTTTQNATATGTDPLWQNLTDALNALLDAGQFPAFHNLYGPHNHWHHQPYITGFHAHAPWVILDLTARRFTVSSRERTLTGDHPQQPRREHA